MPPTFDSHQLLYCRAMEDLELLFNLYVLSHLAKFSVLPVLSLHCQIGQILKFDRYCEINSQPSVSEKGQV